MKLAVLQILPALNLGGVERGTVEVADALVRDGHRSIVVSAGGVLRGRLVDCGSEHIDWPVGRKSPTVLTLIPRLRRLLCHVDIVHCRSRLPAWLTYLAWRSLPERTRPIFLTTVHGPYSVNRYSAIMVRGQRVIAISEFIRDYVVRSYPWVDAERIQVIHRGVDPEACPFGFRPQPAWLQSWYQRYPQTRDRTLLCFPARLTRWKGQEDFIDVLARLRELGSEAIGLLVGGHDVRRRRFVEELHGRVAERGLRDRVLFLGARSDLREILSISDLVFSLTKEPEAFGRTTVEALSLGIPVVGYRHGGTGEILERVYPEGLCPPADPAGAAARAQALLRDRPPVPASHPFTLDAMLEKTLALYEIMAADR
jgi:glycosyltransferase involved in cell wall biosynthesis